MYWVRIFPWFGKTLYLTSNQNREVRSFHAPYDVLMTASKKKCRQTLSLLEGLIISTWYDNVQYVHNNTKIVLEVVS